MDGELKRTRNAQGKVQAVSANQRVELMKFCGERGRPARSAWRPAKQIWGCPAGETPTGANGTVALPKTQIRGRETLREKLKPYLQTSEWSE